MENLNKQWESVWIGSENLHEGKCMGTNRDSCMDDTNITASDNIIMCVFLVRLMEAFLMKRGCLDRGEHFV